MSRKDAEAVATLIVSKHPDALIGKVSVREWDGRKRYP